MRQLIYASTVNPGLTLDDAQHIAQAAQAYNTQLDITGMLLFCPRYFVQVIEGHADGVNHLYHRIARDERHRRVQLLSYIPSQRRQYPRWRMALVPLDESDWEGTRISGYEMNPNQALSALGQRVFNPYELDVSHLQLVLAKAATRQLRQEISEGNDLLEQPTAQTPLLAGQ
jgi:hypothetical protein